MHLKRIFDVRDHRESSEEINSYNIYILPSSRRQDADDRSSCYSKVPTGSDAVLQEGFDHPGSGLGTSARFPQCDATAAKVTTAGGYSLSAITTL